MDTLPLQLVTPPEHLHRSLKMVDYFLHVAPLDEAIALKHPGGQRWKSYGNEILEGNSLSFFSKIEALSALADDDRVDTICEIGFNAGYSSLNFLVSSKPTARLISWDLFEHTYTPFAVQVLHDMFPTRSITVIAGSSLRTVPTFIEAQNALSPTCNLLFVDGGHTPEILRADMANFARLANRTYNRVIVDDIESPDLEAVWYELAATPQPGGFQLRPLYTVNSTAHGCVGWDPSALGMGYDFRFNEAACERFHEDRIWKNAGARSAMGVAEYVFT
jgi:hypothetical protein